MQMRFLVLHVTGIWTFSTFRECVFFAKEIASPESVAHIVENSDLTVCILDNEQEAN